MSAEISAYAGELRWVLVEIVRCLEGMSRAQADWRPQTGEGNSACAIVAHVIGSTRVYALGFGCGLTVERDRPAEFAAAGDDPVALISKVRAFSDEVDAALARLDPAMLDRRTTPPQELWGTGAPHHISRREALVESIRHAAVHLGELRLTRDLARASSP